MASRQNPPAVCRLRSVSVTQKLIFIAECGGHQGDLGYFSVDRKTSEPCSAPSIISQYAQTNPLSQFNHPINQSSHPMPVSQQSGLVLQQVHDIVDSIRSSSLRHGPMASSSQLWLPKSAKSTQLPLPSSALCHSLQNTRACPTECRS